MKLLTSIRPGSNLQDAAVYSLMHGLLPVCHVQNTLVCAPVFKLVSVYLEKEH